MARLSSDGEANCKISQHHYKLRILGLLFPEPEKVNTCVHNLEWSHVRRVLSVTNPEARLWYLTSASENMWSTRDSDQLFAAKYMTYMPTEEELRREIEQQKEFYRLQHKEDKDDGR